MDSDLDAGGAAVGLKPLDNGASPSSAGQQSTL